MSLWLKEAEGDKGLRVWLIEDAEVSFSFLYVAVLAWSHMCYTGNNSSIYITAAYVD